MNKVVGTVGHSMTSHLGYLLSTVTRLAGKTVVGVQHGGHVGYIEDNSAHGYSEYALYDKMITWGWTRIDDHLPQCETIPLPAPKLSEQPFKANYLKNAKFGLLNFYTKLCIMGKSQNNLDLGEY